MNHPKVSVIMPVYNVEPYLRQCLDSLLVQTLPDFELICVDDGSTDSSLAILQEYAVKDSRITVLQQQNQFAGVARNNGMKVAGGKYYVFLDSDDFFEPDLLEVQYAQCEKYGADIGLCGADKYDVRTGAFQPMPWCLSMSQIKAQPFNRSSVPHIYGITTPSPWTKCFSADFVKRHNLQFQPLQRANDAYFTMSALGLADKVVAEDRVLVHYRVGMSTNLQAGNKKTPDYFCRALSAAKEKLVQSGVFAELEKSFANTALAQIQYTLSTVKDHEKARTELLQLLNDRYLEEFGIKCRPIRYFDSPNLYRDVMEQCTAAEATEAISIDLSSMEGAPKVSVLIPVYNTAAYLPQCLDSVTGQTLRNIEIICVNDGSTDNSLSILQEYAAKDPRITVIDRPNMGLFSGRKAAAECCTGEYVMFLDSDDYLEPTACAELYCAAQENAVDILQFGTFVEAAPDVDPQRVKGVETLLTPHLHKIRGDIFESCFVKQKFRFTVWNKIYRSSLVKTAYSQLPEAYINKAEDLYATFALTYHAASYCGMEKKYIHYRFGVGLTGRSSIDLKSFSATNDQYRIPQYIKAFLALHDDAERYADVVQKIEGDLLNEVIHNWCTYLQPDCRKEGFALMLSSWDAVTAIKLLARRYKAAPQTLAAMLGDSTCLPYRPRKEVRTVCVYYHHMSIGGVQRVISELLPVYLSLGYRVILCTDMHTDKDGYTISDAVTQVTVPSFAFPEERIDVLTDLVRQYDVDVFIHHASSSPFLLFDLLAVKACGIPVMTVIHEAFVAQISHLAPDAAYKHLLYRIADRAIVLSTAQEAYWRTMGVHASFIPNPVPHLEGLAQMPADGHRNIVWVGRIADDKNCGDAVRILAKVTEYFPDATLTVVGDAVSPQKQSELNGLIAYYKLKEKIRLVGFTQDVGPHYAAASVYLSTSLNESFSMTLAESKLFGLPAVVYDLPYIDLTAADLGTVTVPQKDVTAAANAIVQLFSNLGHWLQQQAAAHRCAEQLLQHPQAEAWRKALSDFSGTSAPVEENDAVKHCIEAIWFHYLQACRSAVPASPSATAQSMQDFDARSYRIGRLITFIPRKLVGGVRCYREHGMRYTLLRLKEKFQVFFGRR